MTRPLAPQRDRNTCDNKGNTVLGLERYRREWDLKGEYTFPAPYADVHVTRRAIHFKDWETPVGLMWIAPVVGIMGGVRLLWYGSWSDKAFDGDELIEVVASNKGPHTRYSRGYHPFIRIDHVFTLSDRLSLAPYCGGERRGWKNEHTNWWSVEFGAALRWR